MKQMLCFLMSLIIIVSSSVLVFATESENEFTLQYRCREKMYTTSLEKLDSPWILYNTIDRIEHTNMYSKIAAQDNEEDMSFMLSACIHGREIVNKYIYKTLANTYFYATTAEFMAMDALDTVGYYPDGKTYYRYTYCTSTTRYQEYFYYTWTDWTRWGTDEYISSDDCEVETRKVYTVKYDANGGIGEIENQYKIYDETLTLSSNIPRREGYTFKGWSTSLNSTVMYNPGDAYSENETISLYAVWEAHAYTIMYDGNGGTNVPLSQTKAYDEDLVLSLDIPIREGYTFKGWSTTIDGSVEYSVGSVFSLNKSVTLYAVWKPIYTITYDGNGGTNIPSPQIKVYDETLTLSSTIPTREGYTFKGWSTTTDGCIGYSVGATFSLNKSVTLYAIWEPIDASTIIASGICGDNLSWTLSKNGTLIINGIGDMYNWDYNNNRPVWDVYMRQGLIKRVYIEDGVTTIGNYAFIDGLSIEEVIIGNNVITIGDAAFYCCSGLKTIKLGASIENINYYAFNECSALTTININSDIKTIDIGAFYLCKNLQTINITDIKSWCNINFTDTYSSPLYHGGNLYLNGNLVTNLVIPDGVTNINKYAFYRYAGLKSIHISSSVENIGYRALKCDNLDSIVVSSENKCFSSYNGVLYDKEKTTLIQYPEGKDSSTYVVPKGVTKISEYAVSSAEKLSNVILSDDIETIGEYAFYSCKNLKTIGIGNHIKTINKSAFLACSNLTDVYYNGNYDKWHSISIKSGNSYLTDATIHYNTKAILSIDNVTKGDNKISLDINILPIETVEGTVYVALFDDSNNDKRLKVIKKYSAEEIINVMLESTDGTYIQVMFWDSNCAPLAEAIKIDI